MKDIVIHMEGTMKRYNLYSPKILKNNKDGRLPNLIPKLIIKLQ